MISGKHPDIIKLKKTIKEDLEETQSNFDNISDGETLEEVLNLDSSQEFEAGYYYGIKRAIDLLGDFKE